MFWERKARALELFLESVRGGVKWDFCSSSLLNKSVYNQIYVQIKSQDLTLSTLTTNQNNPSEAKNLKLTASGMPLNEKYLQLEHFPPKLTSKRGLRKFKSFFLFENIEFFHFASFLLKKRLRNIFIFIQKPTVFKKHGFFVNFFCSSVSKYRGIYFLWS